MKKICTIAILALCTATVSAQGGGWTSGLLGGYFKLEQRALLAEDFFDKDGNIVSIPRTGLLTTSFYGQFGVLDRLDVNVYVPLFVYNYQLGNSLTNLSKGSKGNIGDIKAGLKYGIIRDKPLVLSVGLRLDLPTGDKGAEDALDIKRFQTGDGEFNQWIHADLGLSLWPVPAYVSAGVAFNNRNSSFSDEFNWYLSSGVSLFKIISVKAEVAGLYALGNGAVENPEQLYGTFLNNSSYLSYGAEVSWRFLPKTGFSLGTDLASSGENILAGPSIYASLHLEL